MVQITGRARTTNVLLSFQLCGPSFEAIATTAPGEALDVLYIILILELTKGMEGTGGDISGIGFFFNFYFFINI